MANLYIIKLINESSLFQHSFLIHYFNGNIFFITHIYIIPFGYCKSQTKSNYFRSIDYISKYSHQKFWTLDIWSFFCLQLWKAKGNLISVFFLIPFFPSSKYVAHKIKSKIWYLVFYIKHVLHIVISSIILFLCKNKTGNVNGIRTKCNLIVIQMNFLPSVRDPFYTVTYCIKWVTTSWTDGKDFMDIM